MRLKLLLIACCYLMLGIAAHAQEIPARAERCYNKAMRYKAKKEIDKACKEMQRAIDEYPAYTAAYSALGQWLFERHMFAASANVFNKASKSCSHGKTDFAKPLARSFIFSGDTKDGLKALSDYKPSPNDYEWRKLYNQAMFINRAYNDAWKDTAFNIGWRLNSKDAELFPMVSADTQTFYFTRRVNNMDLDFYYAVPDSCGGWFTARNMGSPPNTPDEEVAQYISADGHYLFFTRCEVRSEDGWGQGGCDLFMSYRADSGSWSEPQSFGATINTPAYEGMACLSPDNRKLYFVSNRPGGYGGMDIWESDFSNGLWHTPRNLGPNINTAGNEMAPFLDIDNRTLYFASNGRLGMGGYDLYMSRKEGDTSWSVPVNMGYPINTPYDEMSASVTLDGQKLYFSSDRDSVAGNYDIFQMHLPDELQPIPVNYVKGYVYDSLTDDRLNYTSIYVMNAISGDTIYHFISNRGDGSYMITLPAKGTYAFDADRIGYMETLDTFAFNDTSRYLLKPKEHNIAMLPDDYQKPITDTLVCTIHFPLNSYKLTDTDKINIKAAIEPWLRNKAYTVVVNGYTDNSGTPMINEGLSYQRAGLVAKEVLADGVDTLLVQSQGWGEANPVAPNDNDENKAKNRRVEIIISH